MKQTPPPCVVVVTVDADSEALPDMEHHARVGLVEFERFPGFIDGTLHRSHDGQRLVQYLRWVDQASYDACVNDARWDDMPTTSVFFAHVESGRAVVDARIYHVVARSGR